MSIRKHKNRIKQSPSNILFFFIAYVLVALMAIVCVLPFLLILSGSFTDNQVILTEGYSLIPQVFSVDSYKTIFRNPASILLINWCK